jgi:adenosylcobyric acid synthase
VTRALMLQGTGSDVGKSVLVAGLCRAARKRGLNVLPFKPQNMSNNAAVAVIPNGAGEGEIGRAQWLQALACGVAPTTDMNPVLLKPQSETGSQIVVQGRVFGAARARDYQTLKPTLMGAVMDSWERLRAQSDLVIVEGAGSPAEINLRANDIANMGFATRADVPVVLVGDIDRGGVIASLVGTHAILSDEDRALIAGYIINKFRGDASLFDDGVAAIDRHTGWRCFGVVPWLKTAARLPAEDSVALERMSATAGSGLKVAVPKLGHVANFDDLDPLIAEPALDVVFVDPSQPLPADAALVVLPGSKSTIADLEAFRANGWDCDLAAHRARGGVIIGICGGYQMLGQTVLDPFGIEGTQTSALGLGMLAVDTVLDAEKTVRSSAARFVALDEPVEGYEIHLGRTTGPDTARPALVIDGMADGATSVDGKVFGCYLHGLFGSAGFRRKFLSTLGVQSNSQNQRDEVDAALNQIAEELEQSIDVDALLSIAR